MPDVKLPGNLPDTEAAKASQERLCKVVEKVEALLKAELGEDDTYMIQIRDTKESIVAHTGNGCAACAITRMVSWGLETELKHDEDNVPFMGMPPVLPVPLGFLRINRDALRELVKEAREMAKMAELDEEDPDTKKH